jgi:hypothetical protein
MELNLKSLIGLILAIPYALSVKSCPNYTCSKPSNVTACVAVEVGATQNKVYLNDVCAKDQMCIVPRSPWDTFADASVNVGYSCDNPVYLQSKRFPGEPCSANGDCYKSKFDDITGQCVANTCAGYSLTQVCTEHAECKVGLFCGRINATDPTGHCTEQKAEGADCGTSYECPNRLLCLAGKCSTKPYSLPIGAKVDGDGVFEASVYCQFGYAYKGVCSSLNQTDQINKDLDNLRQCNHGDPCHYSNNGIGSETKYCECGYNENGVGYCPRGHDTSIIYI